MKLIASFIMGGLLAYTMGLYYHQCNPQQLSTSVKDYSYRCKQNLTPVSESVQKCIVNETAFKLTKKKGTKASKSKLYQTEIDYYALLFGMAQAESDFRHQGYKGSAGERGLMQIRSCTWRQSRAYLGITWAYSRVWERETSFKIACGYLRWIESNLRKKGYKGDRLLAGMIKSYNVGPTAFLKGREPRITSRYYARVIKEYRKQLKKPTWQNHRESMNIRNAVNWVLLKKGIKA